MPSNLQLPSSSQGVFGQQLGSDYLDNLEQNIQQQEQQQMKQLLAQQNQRGTVSSGDTAFNLAQILGNAQNQFGSAYTNLAQQGASQEEQQQFQQQEQATQFQQALQQIAQQQSQQSSLMELQRQLGLGPYAQQQRQSFGQLLGQQIAPTLGGLAVGAGLSGGNAAYGWYNQQKQGGNSGIPNSPLPGLGQTASPYQSAPINFDPTQFMGIF